MKKNNGKSLIQAYKLKVKELSESESFKNRLLAVLGSPEKVQRFLGTFLTVALSPELAGKITDVNSLFTAALNVAEIGLSLSKPLGHAYLVPYKGKVQLQIGYKGWQYLLRQAGVFVKAYPVFDCDKFSYEVDGWNEKIEFVPNLEKRKEEDDAWVGEHLVGVLVMLKDQGEVVSRFVPKEKIRKMAAMSQSIHSEYSPWQNWLLEMALAKSIKYVISKYPFVEAIEQIGKAIESDNEGDIERINELRGIKVEALPLETEVEALKMELEEVKQEQEKEKVESKQPEETKEKPSTEPKEGGLL